MINGAVNPQSVILIIDLPSTSATGWYAGLPGEKDAIYSDYSGAWTSISEKSDYQNRFPEMPERIIDNLMKLGVAMSVVPWSKIENQPDNLKFLVDATALAGQTNAYDLTMPMRRNNYNPRLEFGFA